MHFSSELAVKINDSNKQNEDNPFMLLDHEQRNLKILRREWTTPLKMGARRRPSPSYLLLYHCKCKDSAYALTPLYAGPFFNKQPNDFSLRLLSFCDELCSLAAVVRLCGESKRVVDQGIYKNVI